jgi:hypothetical protein
MLWKLKREDHVVFVVVVVIVVVVVVDDDDDDGDGEYRSLLNERESIQSESLKYYQLAVILSTMFVL